MINFMIRLISLVFFILFLGSCTTQYEEPSRSKLSTRALPDQESWQSTVTITQDGRLTVEVWAGYIALYKRKNETLLKDSIHVDFYDKEGRHKSVLTAREGIVDNRTNTLTAIGNVVVVSDSGVILRTERLKWDNRRQKIISEVQVIFTTQTDTLIGDSFVSDSDLKNYEIRNARGYSERILPLKK